MSRGLSRPAATPSHARRGAALLLVLGALIVAATVCAGLASRVAVGVAAHEARVRLEVADGLLAAAEGPMREFLMREAPRVVLPPEAAAPEVPVLHESWIAGGVPVALRVTAYDQSGMAPRDAPLSIVRRLPEGARRALVVLAGEDAPGLDALAPWGEGVFPAPALVSPPVVFGAGGTGQRARAGSAWGTPGAGPALGSMVATHNPLPGSRPRGSTAAVVNVNTAPRPLLEATFLALGRGGLEEVLAARGRGERAALPEEPAGADPATLRLAGASPVWSFRVDAAAGGVRRSWWLTYARTSAGWVRAQTILITP